MLCFVFFFFTDWRQDGHDWSYATIKSNVHVFGLGHSVYNLQSFPLSVYY
jgi:hypothetical protein